MVNQDRIQGHWNEVKGELRRRWGQLNEDDLQRARGSAEHLIGVVQAKTGEARGEIERFLNDLLGGDPREVGQQYARAARHAASEASVYARDRYRDVAARSGDYAAQVADNVRRRPGESLAIAFGLGIAAGAFFFLGGRRSR